ncbi:hypothetical protein SLUN_18390 [Streptomyces lunaelactis]|uniref:Uncharacterized protein n=1 Tax=Streptomyces lunaelactis TaxID=1535768 RepID=A0A2R4T412_9ACTN|nr:hypothetical protein [Streptomyces lunaelactis]AVZ73852.1 hypothetical protein SLUN_18390 [Streptomyces lunaelactis]NUK88553.1 hypothetical protein [Streptomyces lunaelactis]
MLIAGAAVLGVVAGVVTGYAVQYDREPTPLPPLSQPELSDSKTVPAGASTTAQSVNVNRQVKTDGDLRKLLVRKPKGATADKSQAADWMSLIEYAGDFKKPDRMFEDMLRDDPRRIATTSWGQRGEVFVTVNLIQFRDDDRLSAPEWGLGQQAYMSHDDYAGNNGKPIPGSGNGRVYVYDEPLRKAGYEPVYQARVIARRGDVVMEIWYMNNTRKVSEKAVMSLAKQQLERL